MLSRAPSYEYSLATEAKLNLEDYILKGDFAKIKALAKGRRFIAGINDDMIDKINYLFRNYEDKDILLIIKTFQTLQESGFLISMDKLFSCYGTTIASRESKNLVRGFISHYRNYPEFLYQNLSPRSQESVKRILPLICQDLENSHYPQWPQIALECIDGAYKAKILDQQEYFDMKWPLIKKAVEMENVTLEKLIENYCKDIRDGIIPIEEFAQDCLEAISSSSNTRPSKEAAIHYFKALESGNIPIHSFMKEYKSAILSGAIKLDIVAEDYCESITSSLPTPIGKLMANYYKAAEERLIPIEKIVDDYCNAIKLGFIDPLEVIKLNIMTTSTLIGFYCRSCLDRRTIPLFEKTIPGEHFTPTIEPRYINLQTSPISTARAIESFRDRRMSDLALDGTLALGGAGAAAGSSYGTDNATPSPSLVLGGAGAATRSGYEATAATTTLLTPSISPVLLTRSVEQLP